MSLSDRQATHQVDCVVIGAGLVGLTAAALLASLNLEVVVVDAKSPVLSWSPDASSARVSAINIATQKLLEKIGCWASVDPQACAPMRHVHAWDDTGGGSIHFDSSELLSDRLSTIVENRAIVKALWLHLSKQPQVSLFAPYKVVSIEQPTTSAVSVSVASCNDVSEGGPNIGDARNTLSLQAQLLVAADGAHSPTRQQLGIQADSTSYAQQALIAIIEVDQPHKHTGLQNFLTTGPLGLLPMRHPYQYNMIWSCESNEAEQLYSLPREQLAQCVAQHAGGHFKTVRFKTPVTAIPLTERHAASYIQGRVALVGDAAHTIHPLAGQGANIGMQDAHRLAEAITKGLAAGNITCQRHLRHYERASKAHNQKMIDWMRAFHETFTSTSPVTRTLRSLGLNTADTFSFLKHILVGDTVNSF